MLVFTVSGPVAMATAAASTPGSTFVDGVGDEVIYFFGFSMLLILLAVAWSSTSVSNRSGVIRAAILVSLIERSRRRSPSLDRQQSTQGETSTPVGGGDGESNVAASVTEEISTTGSVDGKTKEKELKTPVEGGTSDDGTVGEEEGQIRVRLKFLNDTLKQVDARLEDQLGHFKRRHFGEELGENKVVRLIFNGQLLQRDQETLLHYGLFDNCVVHCHISSAGAAATTTTTTQPSSDPGVGGGHPTSSSPPTTELDLSRLMLPLFGLILGLFWCCRVQYRQYFNATSTFALLCITGLFVVCVVAICMPTRSRHPN